MPPFIILPMKKYILLVLSALSLSVLNAQTSPNISEEKFANTINTENARKHLSVLSADEYEGRETGKEGQKKAAKYIAEYFKSIGLSPVKDNEYIQHYPLLEITPQPSSLEINGVKYEFKKDFYSFSTGKSIKLSEKGILFLGYGIEDSTYNDYKNIDVKNKIVLVLGGEPMNEDSVSLITGTKKISAWSTNFRKKSEVARNKGVLAFITVNSNFEGAVHFLKNYLTSPSLVLESDSKKNERPKLLQLGISIRIANAIFALKKTSFDELKKKIYTEKNPVSFDIKTPVEFEEKTKVKSTGAENVLGMIQGSQYPDEYIFVTAHYDHLGVLDGKVFNGADDNGSGTVGVMGIANAFIKAKEAGFVPKRSIVFMTVSGEEKGLLGSSYYTSHPIFPIANTVCDLNIDMIGRTDDRYKDTANYIYVIGSDKISTELHKINENANATYTKLKLNYSFNDPNDPNRFYYRSDHYNFAEKGIPIIFYFNGVHEDYHKETDEIQKINFDALTKRAQLVFYTAWEVANRKDRIKSDVPQEHK